MRLLFIFFLFLSTNSYGQWKSYMLGVKGDTLNRVDNKGKKQGPWVIHADDLRGERGYEEEGYFENGLKEGTWKRFSLDGVKIAEENYRWGKLNGKCLYYTYNGGLMREENWRTIDPANAYDTVAIYDLKDPDKEIGTIVVKNEGVALKNGKWIYYNPREGTVESTEYYIMNKLQSGNGDTDDNDIRPIDISAKPGSDTTGKKTVTKPQEVLNYEKKNSGKRKLKVRDGKTVY